ncbi:MAG: GNAT family N-acetyltransferase [Lysobacteraceae bacterium]
MISSRYTISTATRRELDIAVDWAAAEGWNPGLHDADPFFAADNGGYLIGKLDDQPVSTISAVRYGDGFGFIGFYIVHPDHRGRGLGYEIWKSAMAQLEGRNVGLDGVVDQQDNYRKSGFTLAYRNIRYAGRAGDCVQADAGNPQIQDIAALPFSAVRDYDRPFFPDDREAFLRPWVAPPAGRALAWVNDGEIRGYGVIRACRNGHKIGPLFTDEARVADALLSALCATVPAADDVFLDVPEVNAEAVRLAEHRSMTLSFETARMYTGPSPDLPLTRLFGVTTFELG